VGRQALFRFPARMVARIMGGGSLGDGDKAFDAARLGVAQRKRLLVGLLDGLAAPPVGRPQEIFRPIWAPLTTDIRTALATLGRKARIARAILKPLARRILVASCQTRIAALRGRQHDKGGFSLAPLRAIILNSC